jgi:hypothetical protein
VFELNETDLIDDDFSFPRIDFGFSAPLAVFNKDINQRRIKALALFWHAKRDQRIIIKLHRKSNDRLDAPKMFLEQEAVSPHAGAGEPAPSMNR